MSNIQVIQGRKADGTYAPVLVDETGKLQTAGGGGGDGFSLIGGFTLAVDTLYNFNDFYTLTLPTGTKELKFKWRFESADATQLGPYLFFNNNFTAGRYSNAYWDNNFYTGPANGTTLRLAGGGGIRNVGEGFMDITPAVTFPVYRANVIRVAANNSYGAITSFGSINSADEVTSLQVIASASGVSATLKAGSYIEIYGR